MVRPLATEPPALPSASTAKRPPSRCGAALLTIEAVLTSGRSTHLEVSSRRRSRDHGNRAVVGGIAQAATPRANALQTCATALWLTLPRGPAAGAVLIPSLLPSIGRPSLPRRGRRKGKSGLAHCCIHSSLHSGQAGEVPPSGLVLPASLPASRISFNSARARRGRASIDQARHCSPEDKLWVAIAPQKISSG